MAQPTGEFTDEAYIYQKDTLPYRILYPKDYNVNKQYPLVLFLHGSGERGKDNEKQLIHGGSLFLDEKNQEKYPAIIVFPQCASNEQWTHREKYLVNKQFVFSFPVDGEATKPTQLTNKLVDELLVSGQVDLKQVYIMGISMGGMGTLEYLYRWPNKYTAGIVICGAHDVMLSESFAQTPIWFFHGEDDDVVPSIYSQNIYNIVRRQNKASKYTLYPNTNHNSWDKALAEPNLLKWLFNHTKK